MLWFRGPGRRSRILVDPIARFGVDAAAVDLLEAIRAQPEPPAAGLHLDQTKLRASWPMWAGSWTRQRYAPIDARSAPRHRAEYRRSISIAPMARRRAARRYVLDYSDLCTADGDVTDE